MSYGQPCSRITTGPSAGPVSAYATLSRPEGSGGLSVSGSQDAEQTQREDRSADQTAAGFTGVVVLLCHFHRDLSLANRWPGDPADPLQTLPAFEHDDVSGLCRRAGPVQAPVSRRCPDTQ